MENTAKEITEYLREKKFFTMKGMLYPKYLFETPIAKDTWLIWNEKKQVFSIETRGEWSDLAYMYLNEKSIEIPKKITSIKRAKSLVNGLW